MTRQEIFGWTVGAFIMAIAVAIDIDSDGKLGWLGAVGLASLAVIGLTMRAEARDWPKFVHRLLLALGLLIIVFFVVARIGFG